MSELDKYLDSHGSEGRVDSMGTFTVDFRAAREKMAHFALADPSMLLLKFVQAAVLAESTAVRIQSRREKSTITLVGPRPELLDLDRLVSDLCLALQAPADSAQGCIVAGLNAAAPLARCTRVAGYPAGEPRGRELTLAEGLDVHEVTRSDIRTAELKVTIEYRPAPPRP